MNFATLTIALCMSLSATHVMAQDVAVPSQEQRRGMSYEEYSSVRENMRLRMEKMQEAKRKQEASREPSAVEEPVQLVPDSAYGQGYDTRNRSDAAGRPERPERIERPARIERFNRGDMGRR
jgi:hypothetical protein